MAQLIYTFKKLITSVLFQFSILQGSMIFSTTSRKNPLEMNINITIIRLMLFINIKLILNQRKIKINRFYPMQITLDLCYDEGYKQFQ